MYRVSKILNNNGVIAINTEDNQEYVLLGKGIGFGKKVSQRFEVTEDTATYRLTEQTDRGSAKSLVQEMDPEFLEIADEVIREAEKVFGKVDRRIMIPLADHISFAVARMKNGEQISNPLTGDIHALFYKEFQVASVLKKILSDRMQVEIGDDEIGYVALHVHSAIEDEKVSVAMQMARTVRECVSIIEAETGKKIDVMNKKIENFKSHITSTFIKTQKLITSSYFDNVFNSITDLEGVEKYRQKLYNFKDYLGSTAGDTFFNDYYVNKMMALEEKYNYLENTSVENVVDSSMYLTKKKSSKLLDFFNFIKSLFVHSDFENNVDIIKNSTNIK